MNPERTTNFLMANLGSELARFFNLKGRGDLEAADFCAERALKLTHELKKRADIGGGKREVEILESIIRDALTSAPQYKIDSADLNNYFLPFASRELARLQQ